MHHKKNRLQIILLTGLVLLAVSGFSIMTVHAHGHGGGGAHHAGGGGGGFHHSAHPHVHHPAGGHPGSDGTGYYHSHDDQGKHHHECRPVSAEVAPSHENTDNEECQTHEGKWEPSKGD